MNVLRAYKFRLYPTSEQEAFIQKSFAGVRLVYNLLLQERIRNYKQLKEEPGAMIKIPTPAKYKEQYPFLREVDSLALANAQVYLDRAFKNFYRGQSVGFPKLKRKNAVRSYTTNNQHGTVKIIEGRYLKVPKLKTPIKTAVHRPLQGEVKSATISVSPSGKYFVAILCEENVTAKAKTKKVTGIYPSRQAFAELTSGELLNSHYAHRWQRRLTIEEAKLRRRKQLARKRGMDLVDCKNYQKQKRKVANIREKLLNQRLDFLNKVTTSLITEYDVMWVDDLEQSKLKAKTACKQKLLDFSWPLFIAKLEYKALWYGKKVIRLSTCESSLATQFHSLDKASVQQLLIQQAASVE